MHLAALLLLPCAHSQLVTVNASTVVAGGAVKVSWSGVDLSRELWLGQFSPPIETTAGVQLGVKYSDGVGTPPYTEPAPIKFIAGDQMRDGEYTFIVSNMRAAVNYVLFAGSLDAAADEFEVLATSAAVSLSDAGAPMHLRLARTASLDEMRISWTSSQLDGGHQVQWGLDGPLLLGNTTHATTHTYNHTDLCGWPASHVPGWPHVQRLAGFIPPGYFHEAVLPLPPWALGRAAGLTIHYRVGSPEHGWSAPRSFVAPLPPRAAPPPGRPALSVLILADMGTAHEDGASQHWDEPTALNTSAHVEQMIDDLDLVFHSGDISYATGYAGKWDRFMAMIEPISSRVPYMTNQGNHERDFPRTGNSIGGEDSGGECGIPTQARFHMPTCPPPNVGPCVGDAAGEHSQVQLPAGGARRRLLGPVGSADDGWYAFEQGPVHFAVMNTEMDSAVGSRQHAFFDADLAAVDRERTPWVLFLGHRQMWGGNVQQPDNGLEHIEPLLLQHKVDLAFWGHAHYAQLSCPMVNNSCITTKDAAGYDAPIHAVVGNAGQGLSVFGSPRAPWSVYQAAEWGFSHVTVHNDTHLTLAFHADRPIGEPSPIRHSLTLVRAYPRVPAGAVAVPANADEGEQSPSARALENPELFGVVLAILCILLGVGGVAWAARARAKRRAGQANVVETTPTFVEFASGAALGPVHEQVAPNRQ